jgi:CBS domain-containing protein
MSTLENVIAGRTLRTIEPMATARRAAEVMRAHEVSSLPVVAAEELVGIVTERDLVQRVLAAGRDPDVTLVAHVMSIGLYTARPDEGYAEALARMARNHVRHLLVVTGERLVGVVSMRDLLLVDAVEKSAEIELLTSYIYTVPPVLPPPGTGEDEWAHTL